MEVDEDKKASQINTLADDSAELLGFGGQRLD